MKVEVGDILVCPKMSKNYLVLEVSDFVYLLNAEKMYAKDEDRSISDYWKVSERFLNENFIMM